MWPFSRKQETRNYTSMVMDYRMAEIQGRTGLGELTGTVQSCVNLWENGISQSKVTGTDLLTPRLLATVARQLGLRGDAVVYLPTMAVASQWDISTSNGAPTAYRLTIPEVNGAKSVTALAGEVLHVRIGADVASPWQGVSPLHRASMTAGMLHAIETALQSVYSDAPLGSQVVPFPESTETEHDKLARSFRGQHGRVLLRESVSTTAAGGPTPQTDWKPSDLSPDLSRSMTAESLSAARGAILSVYGVLPALMAESAAGPSIREAQLHLVKWALQPIAGQIAQEASEKLGATVSVDTMAPMQVHDTGARARALNTTIQALAAAKEAGISPEQVAQTMASTGTNPEPPG